MKRFKTGTRLRLQSPPEMATHLVVDELYTEKTLCGKQLPYHPSYDVGAKVAHGKRLVYNDGFDCLHHVDCKRCHALYLKYTA